MKNIALFLAVLLSGCSLVNPAGSRQESDTWYFHSIWKSISKVDTPSLISLQPKNKEAKFSIVFEGKTHLSIDAPCGASKAKYAMNNGRLKIHSILKTKELECTIQNKNGEEVLVGELRKGVSVLTEKRKVILSSENLILMFKTR